MVIGYHLILSAYGFWLPNDPRGSWSDFVGAWELVRFGKATITQSRKSLALQPHNTQNRLAAKKVLKYPDVHFTGIQARAIGRGFADFAERSELIIWACSILPEHVHMLIARHRYKVEQIANLLKGAATRALVKEKLHPFKDYSFTNSRLPRVWAQGEWKVFLDCDIDIRRAIRYVEENPLKEGKPIQHWDFVTNYDKYNR
jgi:REP element-mobilizing transposase RayT